MKPHPEPFQNALSYLQTTPKETALVEDRLVTGIAGGNQVGMYTVWVTPSEGQSLEPLNVGLYRSLEEGLLATYEKLGCIQQNKNNIRDYNSILIDLHFHLRKRALLGDIVNRLSKAVDVICITGRGHRFQNDFEYNFKSFVEQSQQEDISIEVF